MIAALDSFYEGGTKACLLERLAASVDRSWLAITSSPDRRSLRTATRKLASALEELQIELVAGGRGAADCAPRAMPAVAFGTSMGDLAAKGAAILRRRGPPRGASPAVR